MMREGAEDGEVAVATAPYVPSTSSAKFVTHD